MGGRCLRVFGFGLTIHKSEHGGLPCNGRWSTAWISFLTVTVSAPAALGARGAGAESGSAHPASRPPLAHRATATTPKRERPTGQSSRARSRSQCHPGYDDHPVDMRLEDPRDLPAAARHLQRHLVRRQQALRQRPDPLRGARDRSGPSRPGRSRSQRNRGGHPDRSRGLSISSTALSPPINMVDSTAREPAGQ